MANKPALPYDLEKITEFFKSNDFSKSFSGSSFADFNPQTLFAAQQKNMAALVAAGKAVASGYQELFANQVKVFEQTVADAQSYLAKVAANPPSGDPIAQGELVKAAFERAMANMSTMAQDAHKANSSAYAAVAESVQRSIAELQAMTAKFKA